MRNSLCLIEQWKKLLITMYDVKYVLYVSYKNGLYEF